jgi:hypothetical protein
MAKPSSKLVRNERHKLTAGFLNTLAARAIIAAFVAPAVALGSGTAHVPSWGRWAINAVTWIANGVIFHRMALAELGQLEE